jgi:hypothetical protein
VNKVIHTVGDSHCWNGWLKVPGVKFHLLGPMLMHTFGRDKMIVTADMPRDANVIFCWGEIDCRCHVRKHQPWKQTIDDLVKNYIEAIDINTKEHRHYWIFNVVPPPRKEGMIEAPDFPMRGTDDERLSYVKYMNKKLKESGRPFIDVYDKYCDKDGFANRELMPDGVHIGNEKYLIEWVNKNL